MQSKFIATNGIRYHYLEYKGNAPTILLMHGLTANAHAFDGLIKAGLAPKFSVISVDLRGRGLSDKPSLGYSMENHAQDILGILEKLSIQKDQKFIIGGHSFGGYLSMYLGAKYPEKIEKIILMDAGIRMHPNTTEMLKPAMERLTKIYPSFEDYLQQMKQVSFLQNAWSEAMESYYRADVEDFINGKVKPFSRVGNIMEALKAPLELDWKSLFRAVKKPILFIHALGSYGVEGFPPLLPKDAAQETLDLLHDAIYVKVAGNHQTMLYNEGSKQIVEAIRNFIK